MGFSEIVAGRLSGEGVVLSFVIHSSVQSSPRTHSSHTCTLYSVTQAATTPGTCHRQVDYFQ